MLAIYIYRERERARTRACVCVICIESCKCLRPVRVGRSNLLSWRFSPLLQVAELELLRCSRIVLRGHLPWLYWWRWLSVRPGPLWTSCRAFLQAPGPRQGPYRMAGGLRWQRPLGTNTKLDVTFPAITAPVLYQQTYHWTIPAQGHTHTKDYKYVSLPTLQASLFGTFLQIQPDLVTSLKGHSLSPRSWTLTRSAPSERFGYWSNSKHWFTTSFLQPLL